MKGIFLLSLFFVLNSWGQNRDIKISDYSGGHIGQGKITSMVRRNSFILIQGQYDKKGKSQRFLLRLNSPENLNSKILEELVNSPYDFTLSLTSRHPIGVLQESSLNAVSIQTKGMKKPVKIEEFLNYSVMANKFKQMVMKKEVIKKEEELKKKYRILGEEIKKGHYGHDIRNELNLLREDIHRTNLNILSLERFVEVLEKDLETFDKFSKLVENNLDNGAVLLERTINAARANGKDVDKVLKIETFNFSEVEKE